MQKKRFNKALRTGDKFIIFAELTGGPGYNFAPIKKFLTAYKEKGKQSIPAEFDFVGITSPQNPGGVANIGPSDVLSYALRNDLLLDLDFVPHLSCKDQNDDSLKSSIIGYKASDITSILALTGDKPASAKGVFDVEAVGLCSMINNINAAALMKAKPDALGDTHQFYIGAAVSQYKYTEPSQMQQYYKMEKKIAAGASYLITQVGWDWKKCVELFNYIKDNNIETKVIGNVYLLSTITPAPRLMHDIKLPGCFVSDALYEKVLTESVDDHIERAAQQIAMFKALGAAGADVGGVHNYDMFLKILSRAAEIGQDWEKYKENLCWPLENGWYLYQDNDRKNSLSKPKKTMSHKMFNCFHRAILDEKYAGFKAFRATMKTLGTEKGKGFCYTGFNAIEKPMKYLLFDCQECGDCYLPENFSLCTMGKCEKGLDNVPCGDSTADGYCGNNLEKLCVGEYVYNAAAAEGNLEKLRKTACKPRKPELSHSSSILNYLFGKDHTMTSPLIGIGESIHASIPKTGKIMKELHELGPDAYTTQSPQLDYIKALVESQADDGGAYIAINVDAFGEDDPQIPIKLMVEYVKLVRKWNKGVPVCIDSSDDKVLIAGLKEWYNTGDKVAQPLINSVKLHTMDSMFPYKQDYDYSFIGLLVAEDTDPNKHPVDQMFEMAQKIFNRAAKEGFKPTEIFFDSTVFPLSIDMPMNPGQSSYCYNAFETIKKIKSDPKMKDVHFSMGVTNSVRDLPARKIGVCRAYVQKAMEAGLDAAIVNTAHHFGETPADPELVKLVEAFAALDGDMDKLTIAMDAMSKFCQENRKPAK